MSHWQNRSVVVTGGGSGIGTALGRALVERGAQVWLADVNGEAAERAATEIGDGAHAAQLDVADAEAVRAHLEDVAREHGRLDAVFNNAGIGVGAEISELNLAHFDRSLDVNVRGVVHGTLAAFSIMRAQGGGIIVNTASAAGLLPIPLMAPYCMSKHAVVGLSGSLRPELARHGIRLNVLCPMAIETPLLETRVAQDLGAGWRPDIRGYLTRIGGAPYPVDRFVDYALREVERDRATIVAPFGARVRLMIARWMPGLVDRLSQRAYQEVLASRPEEPEAG